MTGLPGAAAIPTLALSITFKFNPPPAEIAGKVVQRKDDTVEAVTTRLEKYHSETAPIVPFYEAKGILLRVDGVGDPGAVTKRIIDVMGHAGAPA